MRKPRIVLFLSLITSAFFFSTQKNDSKEQYNFLFISHTYDWERPFQNKIDQILERSDLSKYDGFWLGGDMTSSTLLNISSLDYLDSLFNLKNPNSHYILGNHEARNQNYDFYYAHTGRPDFYTSRLDNMVITVLNTNLNISDCDALNAQYKLLESTIDNSGDASHYVILMHHQIFKDDDRILGFKTHGDLDFYKMNCTSKNDFWIDFYPKLVNLQKTGTEVVLVVGDTGWDKGREVVSPEGITFLSSGINNAHARAKNTDKTKIIYNNDRVLEFTLSPSEKSLEWNFIMLDSLGSHK